MKYIFSFFLLFTVSSMSAQINVSYSFSDFQNKLGIGYDINRTFSVNANLFAVEEFDNLSPEFTINYNFLKKEHFKLYVGAGFGTNRVYSIVAPIGAIVTPFNAAKNFGLKFEAEFMFGIEQGDPNRFIPSLGVVYKFGK